MHLDQPLQSTASPPATAGRAITAAITIAPARWRDLGTIHRLQREAFGKRLAYGWPTLITVWAMPNVQFLVARANDQVLGCAIGDRHGGQSRIINLAVFRTYRRLGIGRALLSALEQALPPGDLILMVEEENSAAHNLYHSAGYVQAGRDPNYYGPGHHGIWMQKRAATPPPRRTIRV